MKTLHKQILFVIFLLIVVTSFTQALPQISSLIFSIFGGIYLGEMIINLTQKVFPNE